MKKLALPLFLLGLFVAPLAIRAFAKDEPATPEAAVGMKSVAVLSIASYDELMKDLAFLGEISGTPGLDQQLDAGLKMFTQGQGLKGLDTTRPWGVTVQTDDVQFQPLVFLPVKSLKELLGSLGQLVGEPEDQGKGIMAIQAGPQKVFAKEQTGWAFIGQTPESLATLPKDPAKILASLSANYDIALRLNVQNVPEMYRSMAIDQVRAGVEQGMAQQPDEDDETYSARKKVMEVQVDQMVTSINETKEVTLGWKIDREQKMTFVDLRLTAVPGGKLATQIANLQDMPSDFSGFIDSDAAASFNFVSKVPSQDVEQALSQFESVKMTVLKQVDNDEKIDDDETKKALKSIITDLFDSLITTMKAGKMDGGMSAMLGEKEMSLVAGVFVADPKKVEGSVKKLLEIAKKDPSFPDVKLDAVKHKGIRFHTMTVPIPPNEDVAKVLGEKLDVAIGFGAKHVYLAMGTDNIEKVKAGIDKSVSGLGKKYPPARLTLSMAQIMKFAASVSPSPMAGLLADELSESEGKDHIIIAVRPPTSTDSAVSYRLTAEEGVLKLIGRASQLTGAKGDGNIEPPQKIEN